jgi:hypothetical protein
MVETHSGNDTYRLLEARAATPPGGSYNFAWDFSDADSPYIRTSGSEVVSTAPGSGSQSSTFSDVSSGSDSTSVHLTGTDTINSSGQDTSGAHAYTWTQGGTDTDSEFQSGTWSIAAGAGGDTQTGVFSATESTTDTRAESHSGSFNFTNPSGVWVETGTETSNSTDMIVEGSYSSTSFSDHLPSGGDSGWVYGSTSATTTETASGGEGHTLTDSGGTAADSYTWNSTGASDAHSIYEVEGGYSNTSNQSSWADGQETLTHSDGSYASFTATHTESLTGGHHASNLTVNEALDTAAIVTSGTDSRSVHEDGITTVTDTTSGSYQTHAWTSSTETDGNAWVSATTSDTATESDYATHADTGATTLDLSFNDTLATGGVSSGATLSSTVTETANGSASASQTGTATETQYASSTSTEDNSYSGASASSTLTTTYASTQSGPYGSTLTATDVSTLTLAGVVSSASSYETWNDTGTADYTSDGETYSGTSSANTTLYTFVGDNTSSNTSWSNGSLSGTSTIVFNGSHTAAATSTVTEGLGGVASSGLQSSSVHESGVTTTTSTESGHPTSSETSVVNTSNYETSISDTESVYATHSTTATDSVTHSDTYDLTGSETLGLSGVTTSGGSTTTERATDTLNSSFNDTSTATDYYTLNEFSNFTTANFTANDTLSATTTDTLSDSGPDTQTLTTTMIESLGAGGYISSGSARATVNETGSESTTDHASGSRGEILTSNLAYTNDFLDSGADATSLSHTIYPTWNENTSESSTLLESSSDTLGAGGLVSAGSSVSTIYHNAVSDSYSLFETGSQTDSESDSHAAVLPFRVPYSGNYDSSSANRSITQTHSTTESDLGSTSVTLSETLGLSAAIVGGNSTSTATDGGASTDSLRETGSETFHLGTSYGDGDNRTETLALSDTLTSGGTSASSLYTSYTLTNSGTIASATATETLDTHAHDSLTGGVSGTETTTGSLLQKTGTETATDTSTHDNSLHEVDNDSLSTGGTIAFGSTVYTYTETGSDTETLTDSGTQTLGDAGGVGSVTSNFADHQASSDSMSTSETGSESLTIGGTIISGTDGYSYSESSWQSRSVTETGGGLTVTDTASSTYHLAENGNEVLGGSVGSGGGGGSGSGSGSPPPFKDGEVVSGSDTFTWDQGSTESYGLQEVGQGARHYTLNVTDSDSNSWHDTGSDSLGRDDQVTAGDDYYTYHHNRTLSFGVVDNGTSNPTVTYNITGHGTDSYGLTDTGHAHRTQTLGLNHSYTPVAHGSDNYTWDETSSDSSSLTYVTNQPSWTDSITAHGNDSYSVHSTGTLNDLSGPSTSFDSWTLNDFHHADAGETGSGSDSPSPSATDVYNWDGTNTEDYSITASGTNFNDGTNPGASNSFSWYRNTTDYDHEHKQHDLNVSGGGSGSGSGSGSSYTGDHWVADSSYHNDDHQFAYGQSTLYGTSSSFTSSYSDHADWNDSESGVNNGNGFAWSDVGNSDYRFHEYGGNGLTTDVVDLSTSTDSATGSVPSNINMSGPPCTSYREMAVFGTEISAFNDPGGDSGAIHLGTGLGFGSNFTGPFPGNLLQFAGDIVARNLLIYGNVDEIHSGYVGPPTGLVEGNATGPNWIDHPTPLGVYRPGFGSMSGSMGDPDGVLNRYREEYAAPDDTPNVEQGDKTERPTMNAQVSPAGPAQLNLGVAGTDSAFGDDATSSASAILLAGFLDPQTGATPPHAGGNADPPPKSQLPTGNWDLFYNGTTITWSGHGTFHATSGLPGSQVANMQTKSDRGPIPEGTYDVPLFIQKQPPTWQIGKDGQLHLDPRHGIEHLPSEFAVPGGGLPYRNIGWGPDRIRIDVNHITDPNAAGRDGFYLHDSTKGYSHGCIEVSPELIAQLEAYAQSHPGVHRLRLVVTYPAKNASTYGGTKKP